MSKGNLVKHHHIDDDDSNIPSTPGKLKPEKNPVHLNRIRFKLTLWSVLFFSLLLFVFLANTPTPPPHRHVTTTSWGDGATWERRVRHSTRVKVDPTTGKRTGKHTVLVTGAAGFIGSHVASALRKRGDGVLGLDNFNDYYDTSLKRSRQNLLERSGIFIVEGDINNEILLKKIFDVCVFTHVVHLAAQAGVRYAMKNPSSYINSNIAGLVNLLEVSRRSNPQPAMIWASSSSVYGLNTKIPFSEKDRTDKPASLYAATKKAGEEITHSYNHIYGLSITGLRFFTVYGPWGRPDMAYFFFTKDILQGNEVRVFEGSNHATVSRDFTYIDDIVKGVLGALDTAKKSTGSGGKKRGPAQFRIFNLGNTNPVSVNEMVSVLERLLKVKANKKVLPLPRNGDVQFTHANVSLAKREFGYEPSVDLHTGLKKFVKWYLGYYGSSSKKSSSW